MKTLILGTCLVTFAFCHSHGQSQSELTLSYESPAVYDEPNEPESATTGELKNCSPVFTSGEIVSFDDFLRGSVQYPEKTYQWDHQGTVVIGFTVAASGELKDFTVINSVSPESDMEVIRTIKSTEGRWVSGRVEGKPADMQQEVSVIFKKHPNNNFIASAKKYMQKGNQKLFVKNQPKRALAYFNRGIMLLPNDMTLLAMRSLCKHRMGDSIGASSDWERLSVLAERYGTNLDLEVLGELVKNSEDIFEFDEFSGDVEKSQFTGNP